MELFKAVEKLAKLEKVHFESILLFNFDIKMSINSNIKSCDVKSFIFKSEPNTRGRSL